MSILRAIGHLVWADLLERVRRYSFLVVLGLVAIAGYSLVPGVDEPYGAFLIGGSRGTYNSAWIGTTFGIVIVTLLTLLGFFVIRNAINRDYDTRMGQIIAASRVGTLPYLIGKWLSNLAVLLIMLTFLTLLAFVMLLLRNEGCDFGFWALVAPIWLMGVPVLSIVAGLAVLFESVVFLRHGPGNLVYIGFWCWMVLGMVGPMFTSPGAVRPSNDLPGLSATIADISNRMTEVGLDPNEGVSDIYVPLNGHLPHTFLWTGVRWTPRMIGIRFLWIGLAVLAVVMAALTFDRFDPSRVASRRSKRQKARAGAGFGNRILGRFFAADLQAAVTDHSAAPMHLTPVRNYLQQPGLWEITQWEIRLLVYGRSQWWYAGAIAIVSISLFVPDTTLKRFFIPLAWIWPLFIWSKIGSMERRHRTEAFVYPTPRSSGAQLAPVWLAGVIVATILTSGAMVRALVAGDSALIIGYTVGCLFVPALALATGVGTGSGRMFELVYAALWLLGVYGSVKSLDFLGRVSGLAVPTCYLAIASLLLVIATVWRSRQA